MPPIWERKGKIYFVQNYRREEKFLYNYGRERRLRL
jgi:hypothetical protein